MGNSNSSSTSLTIPNSRSPKNLSRSINSRSINLKSKSPKKSSKRKKHKSNNELRVIKTKGVKNFLQSIYGITGPEGHFKIKKIGDNYMIDANI